jgi:hypothetical protein
VGCSSASTYRPLSIAVRDSRTHEPVPDALVRARTVHFFVPDPFVGPFEPYPILDGSPPRSTYGRADESGWAEFEVIVDHPVQVTVTAAGYEPLVVYLPSHPASRSKQWPPEEPWEAGWLPRDDGLDPKMAGLQIRVTPPASAEN